MRFHTEEPIFSSEDVLQNFRPNPLMLACYKQLFQKLHLIASVLPFSFAMKNLFFLENMYCKNVLRPLLHIYAYIKIHLPKMVSRGGGVSTARIVIFTFSFFGVLFSDIFYFRSLNSWILLKTNLA